MRLEVVPDASAVAARAADHVSLAIKSAPATRLVLAGGTTPLACYTLLGQRADLPWGRVTVYFGDERCVPPDDADSNYRGAFESLLRHVHPGSVHRIPGELGPDEAAGRYARTIGGAPLDLVLLGVGPDGHTASLFPEHPALTADGEVAPVHHAPKPPTQRVTLTIASLRRAARVIVLAAGPEKAEAVARAARGKVPAGLIEHAEWIVAADAARLLSA